MSRKKYHLTSFQKRIGSLLAVGLTLAAAVPLAMAATAKTEEQKKEEQLTEASNYATGLMAWGLNDYARAVMDEITKMPGMEAQVKVRIFDVKTRILSGQFKEAEAALAKMDTKVFESWPTILEAADAYFARGVWDKAQYWYDLFFQTFPACPSMKDQFYKAVAYKYCQMLDKYIRDHEKALKVMEYALAARPTTEEKLQLQCEAAQLALKVAEKTEGSLRTEYMGRARKYAEEVQWRGVNSIWFGKSVVVLAHLKELQNDRAGAMSLITEFMPQLQSVHNALEEKNDSELLKLTPMVECKYLLGKMNYAEGMQLIAAGKREAGLKCLAAGVDLLFNVFGRYPSTPWASQAGKLAQEIFDYFDANRIRYTKPSAYALMDVLNIQLKEAYLLMLGRQLDDATAAYEDLLAMFPETEPSIRGIGELARCYYENDEPDVGESVYTYLIERFAKSKKYSERAGDALLILAGARKDAGDLKTATTIYETLIRAFPNHSKRPLVVQFCGDVKRDAGDLDAALALYKQLKDGDEGYESSLGRIAQVLAKKKEYVQEIDYLKKYLERLKPSNERARAQCMLAGAYSDMNDVRQSAGAYKQAVDWMKSTEYAPTPDDGRKNQELLGVALYNLAAACSKLDEPADKKPEFQKLAIRMFNEFVTGYPKSELAPIALLKMGILQTVQNDSDSATRTFEQLGKLYPDSDEARRMYFVRIKALLEMKYVAEAKKSVEKMLANANQYTAAQFMEVAKVIGEHNETPLSVKCYEQAAAFVKDPVKDRRILEGCYFGLGELYFQTHRFADSVESFKKLFQTYPNTGHTIEAAFMQSDAYAELGVVEKDPARRFEIFNEAVTALNKISRLLGGKEQRPDVGELNAKITTKGARISEMKATAETSLGGDPEKAKQAREDANAAYFRLFQFSDPKTAGVGPYMEDAFFKLIPYEKDAGRYGDMVEYCKRYIELFPGGKYSEQAQRWRDEAIEKAKAAPVPATATPAAQANQPAADKSGE